MMLLILCPVSNFFTVRVTREVTNFLWIFQKILEELHHAETGAPCSNKHMKKVWTETFLLLKCGAWFFRIRSQKNYFDTIKKALGFHSHAGKQPLTAAACVSCVKLCKAATYINVTDSANVFFGLLHTVIDEVKVRSIILLKSRASSILMRLVYNRLYFSTPQNQFFATMLPTRNWT